MSRPHRPGPSRRHLLMGAAGLGGITATGSFATSAGAAAPGQGGVRPGSFVTSRGGEFRVDGKPFRFGGTNTYYLHQQSHYMIDAALNDAAAMSLGVVRAWAFADGSGQSYRPLQPEPYVYDDAAFDSLDYAVAKAGALGLRLVLALTNNWPDYGGMQQYVKWFLGLPDDSYGAAVNHDKFYTTPAIRDCYRAYARHVIRRRNPYTGRQYNQDPAIMTFELANEPRNRSDKSGRPVLEWVSGMSRWVKSLAPNQLVAVGDEGFYGESGNSDYPYSDYEGDHWRALISVPSVDYATVHLYPQNWGSDSSTDPIGWGTTWITNHLVDGGKIGKPVVLEEYGLQVDAAKGIPDEATRDAGTPRGPVPWRRAAPAISSGCSPRVWTTARSTRTTTATASSGTTTRATRQTAPRGCSARTRSACADE